MEINCALREQEAAVCIRRAQQRLSSATLRIAMRYPEMDLARSEEIAMHSVRDAIMEEYAQNDPGLAFWAVGMLKRLSLRGLRAPMVLAN